MVKTVLSAAADVPGLEGRSAATAARFRDVRDAVQEARSSATAVLLPASDAPDPEGKLLRFPRRYVLQSQGQVQRQRSFFPGVGWAGLRGKNVSDAGSMIFGTHGDLTREAVSASSSCGSMRASCRGSDHSFSKGNSVDDLKWSCVNLAFTNFTVRDDSAPPKCGASVSVA